ncbi:hypothetical protein SO802_027503 [Lithocarpus litseifolius]|uniref:Uncharacterized protein n=1 Tax=Lithocarpus litseifolius TaxID=425828 RepID=A0AAW2C476_9ROSI
MATLCFSHSTISVAALGFLLRGPVPGEVLSTSPILDAIPKVEIPSQQDAEEATSAFQPISREEGDAVDIFESEDEFEVFNQNLSSKVPIVDPVPSSVLTFNEMGIQHKPRSSLLDLIESQPGRDALAKRKREAKGKEPVEAGKAHSTQEDEALKLAKQPSMGLRDTERKSSPSTTPKAWLPASMLDGAPLPASTSIRDNQGGRGGYVADAVEQALLLHGGMVELRFLRRHEVFLNLKRYLGMMKKEEARRHAAVDALNTTEKGMQELKKKLMEEERERKSATVALDSAERQAEGQRVLLRNAYKQLAASKAQVTALKKRLANAEMARVKARDQVEQEGYDVGVVETEEALRAEVSEESRKHVLPLAIRASTPFDSKSDLQSEVAEVGKDIAANIPTSSGKGSDEVEPFEEEEKETSGHEVVPNAQIPPSLTQGQPAEKEAEKRMEILLAALPLPAIIEPTNKGQGLPEDVATQTNQPLPKEKIVIKKK